MGDEKQIRLLEDKVNEIILREKVLIEEYQKIAIELKELRLLNKIKAEQIEEHIEEYIEVKSASESLPETKETLVFHGVKPDIAKAKRLEVRNDDAIVPVEKKNQKGVENLFGKNIMGVVACILIFIGLISFASLIYGSLSDGIKMIAMFLLSGGFLFAGLFLGRKKRSTFSTLLLGCGVGGMYISIVATRLIFEFSSNISMYLLLFCWIMGVLYLTNRYGFSNVFRLICQIGVAFSVLLCMLIQVSVLEISLLTLFVVITFAIIEISKKETDFIINIGYLVMTATFMMLTIFSYWSDMWLSLLNVGIFVVFYILALRNIRRHQEMLPALQTVTVTLMTLGLLLVLPFGLFDLYRKNILLTSGIHIGIIVAMNLPTVMGRYRKGIELSALIPSLITLIFLMPIVTYLELDVHVTWYFLLYIPFFISGFKRNQNVHQVLGFVVLGCEIVHMMIGCFMWNNILSIIRWGNLATILIMLITLFGIIRYLYQTRITYNKNGYKIVIYMMLNVIAVISINIFEIPYGGYLSLVICTLINILAVYSGFFYKWDERFQWFTNDFERYHQESASAMFLLMVLGSVLYLDLIVQIRLNEAPTPFFIMFVLLALALSVVKYGEMYQFYRKSNWIGPLLGIKLTLLVYAITSVSQVATDYSYIISILFIILACGCIYFGFYKRIASLRVYGLGLAIVAVLKLVTYDISDLNSMIRVLAFILGGILCFVISLLYNNANKKIED